MRISTAMLFLVIITQVAFAQRFEGGVLVGLAATQVDGDGHGGYDKAGPIAGAWVSTKIKPSVLLRMEMRYIQKGSYASKSTNDGANGYYRMRLNYFEMPLIMGYRFINGFNGLIGLSAGYLIKANEMDELGTNYDDRIAKFKKFEFAGLFGVEYNFSEKWKIGGLFSYSILPIRPHPGNATWRWDRGQYNQDIELVVRYVL